MFYFVVNLFSSSSYFNDKWRAFIHNMYLVNEITTV